MDSISSLPPKEGCPPESPLSQRNDAKEEKDREEVFLSFLEHGNKASKLVVERT